MTLSMTTMEKTAREASPSPWSFEKWSKITVNYPGIDHPIYVDEDDVRYFTTITPDVALKLIAIARMAVEMYAVGQERKFLTTERWNEIKEALKEIEE